MVAQSNKQEVVELGISTARGGATYIIASLTRAFVTLLLLVVLARLLKPTEFGLYTIVIALTTLLGAGGNSGVGVSLRKKLPEADTNDRKLELINNAYFIAGSVSFCIAAFGFLLSGFIANYFYNDNSLIVPFQIASLIVFVSTLFNITTANLLGLHKSREASVGQVIFAIVQLLTSVTLVIIGYGVVGAITGLLLGNFVGLIVAFTYLTRFVKYKIVKPTKKVTIELVRFTFPILVSGLSQSGIQSFGVLLLGIFVSPSIVGNYGVAFRLGSYVDTILGASIGVLLPTFSHVFFSKRLSDNVGSVYNNSLYYTLLLLFPILAYLVSVTTPLMALLFSQSYDLAPFYFAVVASGITISVIGRYAGTLIVSYGDVKKFMYYQMAVALLELVIFGVLIPYVGVLGLLLSLFAVGPLLLDFIYIKALLQQFSIKVDFAPLFRIVIATALLGIILVAISALLHQSRATVLTNLVFAVITYPPLLGLFNGIRRKNLDFIKRASHRIPVIENLSGYLFRYTMIFIKE